MTPLDSFADAAELRPADSLPNDPRSAARQLALQFLCQLAVQNGANLDQLEAFLAEFGPAGPIRDSAAQLVRGAWQNLEPIDDCIRRASANWDPQRISLVDRGNLRLAVYQLLLTPDVPPKVVINEALELAKRFSAAQAPAFVNGLLDSIWHSLAREKTNPPNC